MEFESKAQHVTPQKCPVCNIDRENLVSQPINQEGERAVMHVSCNNCNSALMVFISQSDVGMVTFGVMVDVNAQEAETAFSQNPISGDDVLKVHHHLQKEKKTSISDLISFN